jgi:hypothetical protein
MIQLKYNNEFNNLSEDTPRIWNNYNDIPNNIKEFIVSYSNNRIISNYSNNKNYCSCCFTELDKINNSYYCSNCNKKYEDNYSSSLQIDFVNKFDKFDFTEYFYYLVFDVVDGEVILYVIKEIISRDNYECYFNTSSNFIINNAYWVRKDSINDLVLKNTYYYKDLDNKLFQDDIKDKIFILLDERLNFSGVLDYTKIITLYTDNLDILKDTIYKYTYIWDTTIYLQEIIPSILLLTYVPIHFPQFEYLVKYRLYNLAYDGSYYLIGNNFKEIFGLDKSYLSFMQEYNINYNELELLQLCKYKDINFIRNISSVDKFRELLELFNINYKELSSYLDKISNVDNDYFFIDYVDYIKYASILGLDLDNKKVLYPNNFREEHDKLYSKIKILNDPNINNRIYNLSNLLKINNYEDDKYIIYPADSIESILSEGKQQHNCLRTYINDYSNNKTQIYFMRKKSNKSKSFVTIEVNKCKIVQARVKYNEIPSSDIMDILHKWEKSLVFIENID